MNQCKDCIHWQKLPTNPQNVKEIRGECREAPPSATVLPTDGGTIKMCAYPPLPPEFPACSRFVRRELVALGTNGTLDCRRN